MIFISIFCGVDGRDEVRAVWSRCLLFSKGLINNVISIVTIVVIVFINFFRNREFYEFEGF